MKKRLVFFDELDLTEKEAAIARLILREIHERLGFLANVGLEYLTLSRAAGTLSGGEAQRIRLATQIGSRLTGVLYILDEPSIGLHQRDNDRLIETLKNMREIGNTLIVVEHDEDTMIAADYLIDVGPGAGAHGGEIMSAGTPEEVMNDPKSLTGQYLSGKKFIPLPSVRVEQPERIAGGEAQRRAGLRGRRRGCGDRAGRGRRARRTSGGRRRRCGRAGRRRRGSSSPAELGSRGTAPKVGLKPTTPQKAAGMRIEPPPSPPRASGPAPAATATAAPPEEPPGVLEGSCGLWVPGVVPA